MIQCPSRSSTAIPSNGWVLRPLLLTALLACACGSGTRPLSFPAAAATDDAPRRAPGVAIDPAPGLPPARASGNPEQGVVVLQTPPDVARARATVQEFFRAVVDEDPDTLDSLLDARAWVQTGSQGRQLARSFWRLRLSRLDYGALAGQLVYRPSEVETYRANDGSRLRPARQLPIVPSGDDVLVRVVVANPHSGKTRLFGDEIVFLLHPDASAYRITEMAEDFQLP